MDPKTRRLKLACYSVNITMAAVGNLSPILFLTFRSLYGISYSLLGLLVLINFTTQLIIDLIFSFFSHRFDIPKTVKAIPVIAFAGFLVYALVPHFLPDISYVGIAVGTVIFSAAAGLGEVLISPVIAAIPCDDPDREMSRLHSVYAWGSVGVIVLSTVFILIFGGEHWLWLALIFSLIPLTSAFLFAGSEIPAMDTPQKASGALRLLKNKGVWLCVIAIFLGGAAECTMAQWSSGYIEQALGIPKVWGDFMGVALFSVTLGIGRTLYAKFGKNIESILLLGAIGASVCYLIAALSPFSAIGLVACALTGFCTSMLWPGNLVVASGRYPDGGVFIYAMMAAGGDLGASVAPQLVGVITDSAMSSSFVSQLSKNLSLAPEQLAMKLGMLFGMLFPLAAIFVFIRLRAGKCEK
ncbi:MAG: MFS transporter [Clostridia bacterium]|nr:MFS transporter [Clostridia bacterium]